MFTFRRARRAALSAATAGVCALALVACGDAAGSETASGVTDDAIKVGITFPISGASAAYFGPQAKSIEAWVEHVNEQGGVEVADGTKRQLDVVLKDNAFSPERATANAREMVEKDNVFAIVGTPGTAPAAAVATYTESVDVPLLFVQSSSAQWGDPDTYKNTVPIQPRSDLEGRGWVTWLAKEHPGAKIGLLRDNTDFGKGLEKGIRDTIESTDGDIELVEVQSYQDTDNTLDAQITNLKESGANVFFNGSVQTFAPLSFKAQKAAGWDPKIQILTNASSDVAHSVAPAGVENFQDLMTTVWLKDPTSPAFKDDTFMQEWLSVIKKKAPEVEPTVANMFATMPLQAFAAALKEADELSRDAVVKAAMNMKADLPGFAPGVTFDNDPKTNDPITRLAIGVLDGEHFTVTDDVLGGE